MDAKYIDVITDLMEIEGDIIGLEAANKGMSVNEDGLIVNGIPLPKLEIDAFNMFEALKIGEEALINKSMFGRFFGRLNVLFSISPDSRMRKRAQDLMLINKNNVLPGASRLKFNEQCINLFLNAWNYQIMRKEDYHQCESLRLELEKILTDTSRNLGQMMGSYIGMLIALLGFPICPPFAIGYFIVSEILFYYYLILTIVSTVKENELVSGTREEFIKLVTVVVASCYMNGSGKTVKIDKDGRLSVADLQKMKVDIDDAKIRMKESFRACEVGVYVDQDEKIKIAELLENSRIGILSKYASSTNKKHSKAYNMMAHNWRHKYRDQQMYSDHALYCVLLGDVMGSLFDLSFACDIYLTTIVRELYKA